MAEGKFEPFWTSIEKVHNGTINLATGDFSALLLDDTYTVSLAHGTYSDVSAAALGVAGDYPGPVSLAGVAVSRTTNVVLWNANKITFTASGNVGPARWCVIVASTPAALVAGTHLVSICDLNVGGPGIQSFGTEFSVNPINGLFTATGVATYGG